MTRDQAIQKIKQKQGWLDQRRCALKRKAGMGDQDIKWPKNCLHDYFRSWSERMSIAADQITDLREKFNFYQGL